MKISIVIPAYNEERLLGETLARVKAACAAFDRQGWAWEMIVCDNNSSDATATLAADAGARVVFEPLNQIARARNRGAEAADGDWLIFVDADSHPSVELMEDVAREVEGGRSLAGGAVVDLVSESWVGRVCNQLWNQVSRWGTWLAGSFIFVETAVFRDLGGFSNDLFAGEEIEFTLRLKTFAAKDGRGIRILRRHPLKTSGRKLELYGRREMFRFFLGALWNRRVLRSREACHPWYDGRR